MTYEEYAKIRDKKGLSDYKVAQAIGIGRSTFSEWKKGKYQPKIEKINAIKEFLGIKDEIEFPEFEPDHIELIRLYSKLNEEQKKTVLTMLRSLALQD